MADVLSPIDELIALDVRAERAEALLCRQSLRAFIRKVWPLIEPDKPYLHNWHLDAICEVLESPKSKRVIFNVPPGSMKTLLISVLYPAWRWASSPGLRFLTASYGAHRTIDAASKLRRIIESPWYHKHFAVTLASDQNAKTRFNTSVGGWLIASSVGGVGTGEHPDYILIDDPLTEAQSRSEVERSAANAWFDRTSSSRGIARGVKVFVIMQRLHEEDLSGHLLAKGGWQHVCFPMRYEPSRPKTEQDPGHTADPRDRRTTAGALLWPTLFPHDVVRQLEYDLGPFASAGQLQQRPVPEGGGLFKREWFQFVDVLPRQVVRRVRGWDTAGTDDGGDYTVGVRISEGQDGLFYVEDVVRVRVGPAGVDALMLQTAQRDGMACAQREEREGGSAGKAVIAARTRLLKGYDYAEQSVSGDKVTRAKPFRAQVEAGNVRVLRAEWNGDYLHELCAFPTASHDDQVDGSSCGFNALILEPVAMLYEATWGR